MILYIYIYIYRERERDTEREREKERERARERASERERERDVCGYVVRTSRMRSDTGLANTVALLDLDVAIRIRRHRDTAKLRTTILDFRGFDSSRILVLRGAIPMPMGDFPEVLSRRVFPGIVLGKRAR